MSKPLTFAQAENLPPHLQQLFYNRAPRDTSLTTNSPAGSLDIDSTFALTPETLRDLPERLNLGAPLCLLMLNDAALLEILLRTLAALKTPTSAQLIINTTPFCDTLQSITPETLHEHLTAYALYPLLKCLNLIDISIYLHENLSITLVVNDSTLINPNETALQLAHDVAQTTLQGYKIMPHVLLSRLHHDLLQNVKICAQSNTPTNIALLARPNC